MKRTVRQIVMSLACLSGMLIAQSQPANLPSSKSSLVPNLVRFSGSTGDLNNISQLQHSAARERRLASSTPTINVSRAVSFLSRAARQSSPQ